MADRETKVSYTAVSKFADLHIDLDKVLAKIEAIEKAEKRIGKGRKDSKTGSSSSSSDPRDARRSEEANEKRRIARHDQAFRRQKQIEDRQERMKDASQARRLRRAEQAAKIIAAQETRAERAKDQALQRRSAKAKALLDAETTQRKMAAKAVEQSQARNDRAAKSALDDRLRKESAENRKQIQEDVNAFGNRIKDENAAAANRRRMEAQEVTRTEKIKNEALSERIRQQRFVLREREAVDKKRAADLDREIALERAKLDTANNNAAGVNRFSRGPNKVQERSVGPVKTQYDEKKDENYFRAVIRAREQELRLIQRSTQAVDRDVAARGRLVNMLSKIPRSASAAGASMNRSMRNTHGDIRRTNTLLGNMLTQLDRIGRWRPRLMPPFIALIPIIAALLALMNPLVAGLGAVGAAAVGLAGSLGSLAGAALGAIPALASLISVGAALRTVFGGVGKALKAGGQAAAGVGGGGGGGGGAPAPESSEPEKVELTRTEKITRAQEMYRRSIEDTKEAYKALAKAKKDYLKRLKEIADQIQRNRLAERRARADYQLSIEDYYNVMADSSSTKGQKMDAAVGMEEAKERIKDVKTETKDLQKEFKEMKKTGINGDDAVKSASRGVTDAIWAQRDAQIDLANAYLETGKAASAATSGGGGGGGGGIDAFAEAMSKLSPSAQKVVRALLAMQPAWEQVRKNVQERFFREIVDDINLLTRLFPVLEKLLGNTAGALGRVASRGLRLVTSNKWIRDLNILAEQNVPIIENIGDGLLSILDAFMDIAVAAGPFTTALTEGFKKGSANFREFIAEARKTGALADWLDLVRQRMAQWWQVVKNITAAIFNYSAASADFGQWMLDGLEKITKGWRDASEEARKAGSSWKTYLEDIKPALSAVRNMFATFFRWFGREAANPKNIEGFTRIITAITDELGPALARIFDALSETGVGEALLDALIQITETLGEFLEKGGAEGIVAFFETINSLFKIFSGVVDAFPAPVLAGIATALMTISALRFLGITKLIGGLMGLAGVAGKLKGLFATMGGAGAAGGLLGGGKTGKHAAGGKGAAGGLAGLMGGLKGKFLPILGKAGLIGAVAASVVNIGNSGSNLLSNLFSGETSGSDADSNKKRGSDTAKSMLNTTMPGVGLITMGIDALFPGFQKSFDGWIDNMNSWFYDNVIAKFGEGADQIKNWWSESVVTPFSEGAQQIKDWWNESVVVPFSEGAEQIKTWWNDSVVTPFSEAATNISDWWREYVTDPLGDIAVTIGELWDVYVVQPFKVGIEQIKNWWDEKVVTPFQEASTNIKNWWNDKVVTPFAEASANVKDWWNDKVVTPFAEASANVKDWWQNRVVVPFQTASNNVRNWWNERVVGPFSRASANVRDWWNTRVVAPFQRASSNVRDWWNSRVVAPFSRAANNVRDWWNRNVVSRFNTVAGGVGRTWGNVTSFFTRVGSTISRAWTNVTTFFSNIGSGIQRGWNGVVDWFKSFNPLDAINDKLRSLLPGKKGWNGGVVSQQGIQKFYRGGEARVVPGARSNSDNIPALLTAGEVIFSKAAVARAGGADNLLDFNEGKINFGEMLLNSAFAQSQRFNSGGQAGSLTSRVPAMASQSTSYTTNQGGHTDNSVNIEKVEINNPVGETTEVSLANQVRNFKMFNGGRG